MKAVVCEEYGALDALNYRDFADPECGDDEVVIEAEAIGVNYPDGLLVQGLYQAKPPTPFVPGMEVVGHVMKVGKKVEAIKVGERVGAIVSHGAYAEKVCAKAARTMPVPDGVDAGEITALMCGYGTSHYALKQRGQLNAGETLVVTGASGLTGLAAVQLGKVMGARVIAVASTSQKQKLAKDNGADLVLGYDNLKDQLKEATQGKGADVVFDVVGGDVFDACSRSLNWGGRLLVIGFASGTIPKFPVNLALVKGYSVVGVFWGSFTEKEPEIYARNMAELLDWYLAGKVRPHIEKTYQLADAVLALEHVHDRKVLGKLVLKP